MNYLRFGESYPEDYFYLTVATAWFLTWSKWSLPLGFLLTGGLFYLENPFFSYLGHSKLRSWVEMGLYTFDVFFGTKIGLILVLFSRMVDISNFVWLLGKALYITYFTTQVEIKEIEAYDS